MKPELAFKYESDVGEGPIWDPDSQELIWIDVTRGLIHQFNPKGGEITTLPIGQHIGAVGLFSRTHYIAAVRDGFAKINCKTGEVEYLHHVLHSPEIRFNDGKCDPRGRFVAGTMRYEPEIGTAALYSCAPDGIVTEILSGVGLSNGLCWNETGDTFFYIDTLTRSIARFDYDLGSGKLSNKSIFFQFDENDGSPDGMAIDSEESIWVALWGGSKIIKIDRNGSQVAHIEMPVSQPTSLTFGGGDLRTLYVTSARFQLKAEQLAKEPLAGSIFSIQVEIPGLAEPVFGVGRLSN